MTRLFAYAVALLITPATGRTQAAGTVLTSSEISSEHLLRRPVPVEGRDWLGLSVSGERSVLESVQLEWVGAVMFEDSVFTLSVASTPPHLLIADVPQVAAGPATTVVEFETSLSPDARSLPIAFGTDVYELELGGSDPMLCDAQVTLTDGRVSQTLYVPDYSILSCDEPHFSVQWAGDLDGDGRLDLVTTFSPKYSFYPRRLYLSSAAPAGMLVGLVAVFDLAAA